MLSMAYAIFYFVSNCFPKTLNLFKCLLIFFFKYRNYLRLFTLESKSVLLFFNVLFYMLNEISKILYLVSISFPILTNLIKSLWTFMRTNSLPGNTRHIFLPFL